MEEYVSPYILKTPESCFTNIKKHHNVSLIAGLKMEGINK